MTRFANVVIRASAGTGKTFQLSNRFLGLLVDGAPVDQILATTFTRKAAGEILDRVILRLAEAAESDDGAAELARALRPGDGDGAPPLELGRRRCQALLRGTLRNLHRLRVCTLDSFFSQIAGSFSLELGLPPGWRIVEPLEDEQLRSEATELILRGDADTDIVRLMHLVTKGEAERSISQLVRETVRGLYGLYAETEEDAWRQFPDTRPLPAAELEELLGRLEQAPLPEHAKVRAARDNDLAAARGGDWERIVGAGLGKKVLEGEPRYYRKELPPETVAIYSRLVEHARGVLVGQLAAQTAATYRLLDRFDGVYQRLKDASLAMRFEDVTRRLAHAARPDEVERLEYRLDAPISHLLLDEFQDTSLPQWLALRPFAERVTATGGQQQFLFQGGQQSFFCVGDVKQAIYGWRGGKSEIFLALEAHLDSLEHESLHQSFRSSPIVIETVNRLFLSLGRHGNLEDLEPPIREWLEAYQEHTTARRELAGYTALETAPRPEESGVPLLEHAARRVAELSAAAPGRTVGVLARRNTVVAELIFRLRQLGVDASEEGGNPLTDSAAVQLILSLLRMTDHPGDTVARYHVARSPLGRILGFTSHMSDEGAERLARDIRRRLLEDGYGPTMMRLAAQLAPWCGRRDLSRLEQLVQLAFAHQQRATLRTARFVAYVQEQRVPDPSAAPVRVMTIHQAKGLQFDIVVLPDLDMRIVGQPEPCVVGQEDPTRPANRVCLHRNRSIQSLLPPELQRLFTDAGRHTVHEALCVLYVAVTRAVHALHMIVAPAKQNERHLPKTFAGLVRGALADGAGVPGAVLFEHGDRDWLRLERRRLGVVEARVESEAAESLAEPRDESPHVESPTSAQQAGPSEPAQPVAATERVEPLRITLAPMPDGRRAGVRRAAPSGLEGGVKVRLGSVLRLDNAAALARGTMIHAWFEQIRWLDDGLPSPETLRRIAAGFEGGDLNIDEALRQFHTMLMTPEIGAALRRQSYEPNYGAFLSPEVRQRVRPESLRLEVHNERRFAVREADRMLSGTIDRLVLIYNGDQVVGADVIDYKTDAVSTEDQDQLAATIEHYRPQQEAYRAAVSKMFGLAPERISARLLLLGPGIVRDL